MSINVEELRAKKALFSEDRLFRYALWREWNAVESSLALFINELSPNTANKGFVNWLCLNPSTADETLDDQTISKCTRLSKKWGYSGFCMTNLFAYRATDPEEMKQQINPIGANNDHHIIAIAKLSSLVLCGWGNHGSHQYRSSNVLKLLQAENLKLHCLRITQQGQPEHPLYLPESLIPKLIT